jgi:hypothetical protein
MTGGNLMNQLKVKDYYLKDKVYEIDIKNNLASFIPTAMIIFYQRFHLSDLIKNKKINR